ncbi:hypothetical protein TNCV_4723801 [Trichonephila clavipes]|uniref:Uncharacterized protein n=1 Tax=Trichonephila clavipes TaxID=2585209 RepID=A0A8X7BG86_TRICX|nr:hypothetical protein TNCV_4723801 [Trichonephila clavipes]
MDSWLVCHEFVPNAAGGPPCPVGKHCTLNLSTAQTSSCWSGVVVRRGRVPEQLSASESSVKFGLAVFQTRLPRKLAPPTDRETPGHWSKRDTLPILGRKWDPVLF